MNTITRFGIALALISATIPFVAAVPGSSSCNSAEFWYDDKSCCLPLGGPSSHHQPPPDKECPPNGWSWSKQHGCCVPHYPHPHPHPPPQCPKDWDWSPATFCCEKSPNNPHPPHPQPSGGGYNHGDRKRGPPGSSSCGNNDFWFNEKSCCLPRGGPNSHPKPPSGKQCPSKDWSWSQDHSCCVPHQPRPHHHPPPQCPPAWDWAENNLCCKPHNPKPSDYANKKRHMNKSRSASLCPMALTACPIAGASGLTSDFECLDIANELESCGGCASVGQGEDCTAIRGAWNVGCEQGSCAVYNCAPGFKRSKHGRSCIPI